MSLLRHVQYGRWFLGDTLIAFGAGLRAFALPLVILSVTGSVALSGIAAALSQVAAALVLLPGGILKDSRDKRKMLWISAVFCFILYILAIGAGLHFMPPETSIAIIILCSIGYGIRSGLFIDLTDLILPDVVDDRELADAYGTNAARDSALSLLGGPVAASIMKYAYTAPLLIEAVGALITATLFTKIQQPRSTGTVKTNRKIQSAWKTSLFSGFSIIWRDALLKQVMVISLLVIGSVNALLTLIILTGRAAGWSLYQVASLEVVAGLAGIAGGISLPFLRKFIPDFMIARLGVWIIVAAYTSLVHFGSDFIAIVIVILFGSFALPAVNGTLSAQLMLQIPASYRGRVLSSFGLANAGAQALILAILTALSGYSNSGTFGFMLAACLLLTGGLIMLRSPIRNFSKQTSDSEEMPPLGGEIHD